MSHLFISYSKKDITFARHLRSLLQDAGFVVWMDETKLVPSERWWPTIERNIITCKAFIVIMSPNSKESDWVEREILVAEDPDHRKPIFPVLLEGKAWSRLGNVQYEDMRAGLAAPLRPAFVNALQQYAPTFTGSLPPPPLNDETVQPTAQSEPRATSLSASSSRFPVRGALIGAGLLVLIAIAALIMLPTLNPPALTPTVATQTENTLVVVDSGTPTLMQTLEPSITPSDSPSATLTDAPSVTLTNTLEPTLVVTDTPTLDIAQIVASLDSQATRDQATLNAIATTVSYMTSSAVTSQAIANSTATATLWTVTPTASYTLPPNLTASIDAFRTHRASTATAQQIRNWTPTATNWTVTPSITSTSTSTPSTTITSTFSLTASQLTTSTQASSLQATLDPTATLSPDDAQAMYETFDTIEALVNGELKLAYVSSGSDCSFSADKDYFGVVSDGIYRLSDMQRLFSISGSNNYGTPIFSEDGRYVAVENDGVYLLSDGTLQFTISGSPYLGNPVFSPDGTYIAVPEDGVYRLEDGQQIAQIYGWRDTPFSPSGEYVNTEEGVYRLSDGQLVFPNRNSSQLYFSPDWTYVAIAADGVYRVADGARLFSVRQNHQIYNRPSFSSTGMYLAVEEDGIYRLSDGQRLFEISGAFPQFSGDEQYVALHGDGVYRISDGLRLFPTGNVIFSPNSEYILITPGGVYRLADGREVFSTSANFSGIFSQDSQYIAVARDAFYRLSDGERLFNVIGNYNQYSPNEQYLSIDGDGIYLIEDGQQVVSVSNGSYDKYSPNSDYVIVYPELYRISDGESLLSLGWLESFSFTEDGAYFIAERNGVYRLSDGQQILANQIATISRGQNWIAISCNVFHSEVGSDVLYLSTTVAANIRSLPQTDSSVVISLPPETTLISLDQTNDGAWYRILGDNNDMYWISSSIVAEGAPPQFPIHIVN